MEILQVYVPTITNLEGVGQQLNLDSIVTKLDNQKYRLILLLIVILLLIWYYKSYKKAMSTLLATRSLSRTRDNSQHELSVFLPKIEGPMRAMIK